MVHQPKLMPGGHKLTREKTTQVPRGAGDQNRASILHAIQFGRVVRVSTFAPRSNGCGSPAAAPVTISSNHFGRNAAASGAAAAGPLTARRKLVSHGSLEPDLNFVAIRIGDVSVGEARESRNHVQHRIIALDIR